MDQAFANIDPNRPVIALQHNPVYPKIDSSYPYNIRNMEYVMEYYSEKNVILSISGHLHRGTGTHMTNEGVQIIMYVPPFVRSPFRYTMISLRESDYEISGKTIEMIGGG
jgi:calcineurin-like phosphoesterase family protein